MLTFHKRAIEISTVCRIFQLLESYEEENARETGQAPSNLLFHRLFDGNTRSVGSTSQVSSGPGEPRRRSTVLASLLGPVAHNLGVDGAGDAVVELGVQLGQRVRLVDASHCDVPHGGSLHDVADDKLLDGLVLGHATSAVGAPYGLDVTATVLGATVVSPFRRHRDRSVELKRPRTDYAGK